MGMNLRLSSSASGTRNVPASGFGGGQYLIYANALSQAYGQPVSTRTIDRPASSTADYYHIDGHTDFIPWDLLTMGSPGAAIAAAKGYRYLWLLSCDHSSFDGWANDGVETYAGFSNDPHVFPEASTLRCVIPNENAFPGKTGVFSGFNAWLVYNPDDATYPFYIYTEGGNQGGDSATPGSFPNCLNMVCYKTADFDSQFIPAAVSHPCTTGFGLTAYQRVYRLGTGNWISFGGGDPANNGGLRSKWTSTDGLAFTNGSLYKQRINSSGVAVTGAVTDGWVANFGVLGGYFQIGSDYYVPTTEDRRGPGWSSGRTYAINEQVTVGLTAITYKSLQNSNTNHDPASNPAWWQNLGYLGEYVTIVPFDIATGDMNFSGTPPMIRISDMYKGVYPDTTYLNYAHSYVESGVLTIYAVHGFFNDTGIVNGFYEEGGGLDEQYMDVYAYVIDATAALASAPFNVKASCTGGVVTLSWADLPSGRSYRIKRGTSFGTYGTTVSSSVTGTTITDSPTVGSVYYYQVISLNAGVEQASRVVSTYVS